MTPTMQRKTLLWIFLIVILLEGVYMNSVEKRETAEEKRPQRSLTRMMMIMRRERPMNYPFPIVSKDGVLYYDLANESGPQEIFLNSQSVEGITATHDGCSLQSLHLGVRYQLDKDLFSYCPQLHLTLEGREWLCIKEGLLLKEKGVEVDMSSAKCTDTWHDNTTKNLKDQYFSYPMKKGIEKLMEYGITNCSEKRCECKWYFKEYSYVANLNCEGVGLTDDTLPILPNRLQDIRLENNDLRSIDKLVKHLLPHNQTLRVLRLDKNHIDTLPHFPAGSFPNIEDLSLSENKIEKIDIDAFKELVVTRKELMVHLQDNIFPCDCTLYKFKIYLARDYIRHWKAFIPFINSRCKSQDENKSQVVFTVSKETCSTWSQWPSVDKWSIVISILSVLNLFIIYLILNLMFIMKFKKGGRPVMDRLVCAVKSLLYLPFLTQERNFTTRADYPLDNTSF